MHLFDLFFNLDSENYFSKDYKIDGKCLIAAPMTNVFNNVLGILDTMKPNLIYTKNITETQNSVLDENTLSKTVTSKM